MAHYSINQGSAETCQVCERMVERMLELHKQSAVVRSPLDKERVGRVPGRPPGIIKIESTDKSIDRLVYELSHKGMIYGLTDDEINIVEGR